MFRKNIAYPFSRLKSKLCLPPASCWLFAWLALWPWRWRHTSLHTVTIQKTPLSNYYIIYSSSQFLFIFSVWEYVRAELQPSCPLICLRGYGIVGTVPDLTETVELENSRAYSILLLPDMPGVTFRTFQLDKSQVTKLQRSKVSWNSGNRKVFEVSSNFIISLNILLDSVIKSVFLHSINIFPTLTGLY